MEQIERSYGIIPLKDEGSEIKIFLVKLASGHHWGFPKGHSEKDEMPKECAKRELFEETQLKVVSFLPRDSLKEEYTLTRDGKIVKKIVELFPAYVEGNAAIQTGEILEGDWFDISLAKELLTYDASRQVLKKLLENLPNKN